MTWFDVALIGVLVGAVVAMLAWAGILPRKWAVALWAAVVSAASLTRTLWPANEDDESGSTTTPYDTNLDDEYGDDDETLDLGEPADGDDFLLDLHRRGSTDVRGEKD